ncbi:MAG: hypothetical protein M3N19_04585, partial [Candidatus Eremiobacteraeota bacterium]|nr:hypothetical protein [Candidatus Eremiobacteraeota bacterium]
MDIEQIPVSDEVLTVMRSAATKTLRCGENFVSPRTMMIALAEDPILAEPLKEVVDLELLQGMVADERDLPGVTELPEDRMGADEQPALLRYDTLAFKDLEGSTSVWLNAEAFAVFLEGARYAEDGKYLPKHLALG